MTTRPQLTAPTSPESLDRQSYGSPLPNNAFEERS